MSETGSTAATAKWRTVFDVSTTLAMVVLAALIVWQGRARFFGTAPAPATSVPVPKSPISIAGKPTLGKSTARLAIVIYSDFEYPYCGVAARTMIPTLVRDYVEPGKAVLVFKNLPLPSHTLATAAAVAAGCAGDQGKFWPMHDHLFAQPGRLAESELRSAAGQVGLDLDRFEVCRSAGAALKSVDADRSEAESLKITGTPTFILGTIEADGRVRAREIVSGAKPITTFRAALDRLLAERS